MVSTVDVGELAAELLLRHEKNGFTIAEAAGAESLTLSDVASVLGGAIGQSDLKWVQFPYDGARASMIEYGFSNSVADAFVQFAKRANDGSIWGMFERTAANTTPGTLQSFAPQFAAAYAEAASRGAH
jgi:hypothetical protein